jgi:DNA-nicking Smr family endonuclease
MSRRRLSDEEAALWEGIARSISPLRRAPKRRPAPEAAETEKSPVKARSVSAHKAASKPASGAPFSPPKPVAPPALAPLGRKLKQRIARGTHAIDGRLDLHGFTQAEAHGALLHFLASRQARGARVVLVITGKGARTGDPYAERGVLKRMVPLWLRLPEFRPLVIGFETAAIGHGGEGALYVTLRRGRQV